MDTAVLRAAPAPSLPSAPTPPRQQRKEQTGPPTACAGRYWRRRGAAPRECASLGHAPRTLQARFLKVSGSVASEARSTNVSHAATLKPTRPFPMPASSHAPVTWEDGGPRDAPAEGWHAAPTHPRHGTCSHCHVSTGARRHGTAVRLTVVDTNLPKPDCHLK